MGSAFENGHAARIAEAVGSSMAARSPVAASWERSLLRYGLNPLEVRPPRTVTAAELRSSLEIAEPLLHSAQPLLDRLFQAVGNAGCCVLFSDTKGVPIDRRGCVADDQTFYQWGLWTGAVWSEEAEGTNGIGTCLAENRALTIHRDQHFHARNTGLTCIVAPIFDHKGQLAGAIDVSSCRADLTEGYASLIAASVAETARQIEALNFRRVFAQARIVLTAGTYPGGMGLLAIDQDDIVIGATRNARIVHGITDAQIAATLPAHQVLDTDPASDLASAERGVLLRALASAKGNVSEAAARLNISRATLHRKMKRLDVRRSN